MAAVFTEANGVLIGPPRTAHTRELGAVHDPDIAARHGFRGGIVGGSRHLNIFAPLMVELWGPAAFERGGVSIYFESPVVSGEQVQAFVRRPAPDALAAEAWIRRGDAPDIQVGTGSLTLGDHSPSELKTRPVRLCDAGEVRILRHLPVGGVVCDTTARVPYDDQALDLSSGEINEPLDWYVGASPWGGPIAAISSSFRLPFYPANAVLAAQTEGVVPMGGAVEICFDRGPIFLDRDYGVRAVSAGVGHSPKTEYVIIDFSVDDEAGQRIASARQVYRFLKKGSGLYPELDG